MRKALVIGIDDYPTAPLNGCVNDANSIRSVLEVNGDGSPNFEVKLITSPGLNLPKTVVHEAIDKLFQGDSDIALLYFSGHGTINSTGGYIVTSDAQKYAEGMPMDQVLQLANQSKAKNKVIIFDCCFSGAMGTPMYGNNSLAQLAEGMTVLTACKESETAVEVNGGGIFTSLVVDALQGGAADLRGHITPGSVYAYVDQALGAWDQRPIFKTNVSKFTSLRKITPQVPLNVLRKICEYFPVPEHQLPLNPTFEPTSKNADPKNNKIFSDLQLLEGVGLVVPVDEEHMYYAAMNSTACSLTALGYQYWRLSKERKI